MGAFASLSCEAYFLLSPGGQGVVGSGWGELTLTPPARPSQSGPWPWPPVLGGAASSLPWPQAGFNNPSLSEDRSRQRYTNTCISRSLLSVA